jgi:hypothetical protein
MCLIVQGAYGTFTTRLQRQVRSQQRVGGDGFGGF